MSNVMLSNRIWDAMQALSGSECKRVLDFVAKFQKNPAHPGLSLERLDRTNSKLWSGRISDDLRAILFQDGGTWTILYCDHHDKAYKWAENRQVLRHPATGALQIVESTEVVEKKIVEIQQHQPTKPDIFGQHTDAYLLSLGVPELWLPTVRKLKSEEALLEAVQKLPEEVGERLLDLASGKVVTPPAPVPAHKPSIESPDTQRRFYVLESDDELLRILDAPLSQWTIFLHPSQRKLAYLDSCAPMKITGSAGTGKTVVALHRARHLARKGHRVLLTTFVTTLCQNIQANLKLLCSNDELNRITVCTVHGHAMTLLKGAGEHLHPVDDGEIAKLFDRHVPLVATSLSVKAVFAEWKHVIQAQGLESWDAYRGAPRTGRGTPLKAAERKQIWTVVERVQAELSVKSQIDWPGVCNRARVLLQKSPTLNVIDAVIVDEVQDLSANELRFLSALVSKTPGGLTLFGDGGQRIYAMPFSLKALGIDIRGRSHVLRVNYRTTEQIRSFADSLLDQDVDDLDDGKESRTGTRCLLRGPKPALKDFADEKQQAAWVAEKIDALIKERLKPGDVAVFARAGKHLDMIETALKALSLPSLRCTKDESPTIAAVTLGSMHRAKGLEFKAVFVIGISDDQLPNPSSLKNIDDPKDRDEALNRERQLLYVSITRARDEAYVTWAGTPSRFLAPALKGF